MSSSNRSLALLLGAVILLSGVLGTGFTTRQVSASGIGWDKGITVTAAPAPATQPTGIGWD